ncbi:protein MpRLK-Pelle_L-LEC10 [Marchantia polymorpha subsp. ruderalis]|uniref:Protein kinase domain-containing protein n=1 Tax=Marchantia polymorpha subsp. ruderalis TaxID=1480154 RepID=A0AAF6BCA0_MARPO|nr:hypothetical protein Mp_4g21360 [Marchantia polymorpha subsp. ruderalis]
MAGSYGVQQALLALILCSSFLLGANAFDFSLDSSSFTTDNMILLGGAHLTGSENGSLSLIPELPNNPQQASGVAYYHAPVRMLDPKTNKTASFSTKFTFHQIPESYNNSATDRRGDGMTFVFSSSSTWVGGAAGRLGILPLDQGNTMVKLFLVEYDTFQNSINRDPAFDHVGVDTMSAVSEVLEEVQSLGLNFWTGEQVWSWIEYNGTSKVLEVRVANSSSRPDSPLLQYTRDLVGVVNEQMWVGFSAGTGDAYSYYFIDSWEFEIFGLPAKKKSVSVGLIAGCVAGGVVMLVIIGLGVLYWIRKKRREAENVQAIEDFIQLSGMPDHFSYKQLSVATKSFSETSKLGEGGFGSVYKGILPSSGTAVAVKRVGAESRQGEREFLAEVSIISQLRHRNVVQLMGYCRDGRRLLLVYEYMPNGSLDRALLHPSSPEHVLSWERRMKILSGLASALHYLHEGWKQQVIHRDVKSSNVMLDDEFNAKLGDFGLDRLVDHSKHAETTMVAGTYGFIAPEAIGTGKFTDKTDVYAFGAVVLEIATGRKAFDSSRPEDEMSVVDMVWDRLKDGKLISVVDKRLDGKYEVVDLEVMLLLGLICSHPDPKARPSMRQVVQVLAGDAPVPPVPLCKPSLSFSSGGLAVTLRDLENTRSTSSASGTFTDRSSSTSASSFLPNSSSFFTPKQGR